MELKTVYCTNRQPDAQARAREEWGTAAQIGYPGTHDTGPYDPDRYEIVGYVATHRTGPRIPVLLPRKQMGDPTDEDCAICGDSLEFVGRYPGKHETCVLKRQDEIAKKPLTPA